MMAIAIDWSILGQGTDAGQAFRQSYDRSRERAALGAVARDPTDRDALAGLYQLNPTAAATMEGVGRDRVTFQHKQDALTRETQARSMIPDVLAGLGLGGPGQARIPNALAPASAAEGSPTDPVTGDVIVTARPRQPEPPRPTAGIADLYRLSPELANGLVPRIGEMAEQDRKRLGFEADELGIVAFAARQVPYEQRSRVIDAHRRRLVVAGFTDAEVDDFDPSDEALSAAITHSLGIKGALSQQLDEQKFDWQRRDDRIDNARDDRRVGIQANSARDASARGWSADRRAERRFKRGDGMNVSGASTDDLLGMLEGR